MHLLQLLRSFLKVTKSAMQTVNLLSFGSELLLHVQGNLKTYNGDKAMRQREKKEFRRKRTSCTNTER